MTTFVLGDIHGQFDALQSLLERLAFRPKDDRLWLVGDLVNRGPRSLDVLRWAKGQSDAMGDRFVTVLGNHDLHLLALARGVQKFKAKDEDLRPILEAPDHNALLDWFLARPLLHHESPRVLVHAGLHPKWTPKQAEKLARKAQQALTQPSSTAAMLRRKPPEEASLREAWEALQIFTNLRTCQASGEPCSFKGPPEEAPPGCLAWFQVPGRRSRKAEVLFGHWAALGRRREPGVQALDSGAAWGGHLTALRLEDEKTFQVKVASRGVQ